jgi:beta-lactam-binding protein with PASTA domain
MNFKKLLIHLTVAAVIGFALVLGSKIFLDVATMHGKVQVVPDFTNMSVAEAKSLAEASYMRIDVVDSLYVKRMAKGHIYRQTPKAGSEVKKGRRILVTINALSAKKVEMPDLIGFSMRQATAELQSRGLVLGNLVYKNDMATDNVLAQRCRGRIVAPGTKLETGTVVDLVVGLSEEDMETMVPDIIGMKCLAATDAVHSNSLNVRSVYDSTVKDYNDSLKAVVYSQSPSAESIAEKGTQVTMFLTTDSEKYTKENADGAVE